MLFFVICACFALFPENVLLGAQSGLALCINAIIPSLLPFMLASDCLIKSGFSRPLGAAVSKVVTPFTGISPAGCVCLVTGLLGGFGAGARAVYESYEENAITKDEAQKLLPVCNNAGPLFVIGTVGISFFSSAQIGLRLLAVHIITAFIIGILIFYTAPRKKVSVKEEWKIYKKNRSGISGVIAKSAATTGGAIVTVCVFVITFSAILEVIPKGQMANIAGIFEVMRGCAELARGGHSALPMVSAVLFWGGISVHMQANALCRGKLSILPCIIWRAAGGVIAYILTRAALSDSASLLFLLIFTAAFFTTVFLIKSIISRGFFRQPLSRQRRRS